MEIQIDATLEYGQGYNRMNYQRLERISHNCDNFDYISSQKNPFIFHIYKIFYSLTKENIKSLKVIYRNRKTQKLITLFETPNSSDVEEIKYIEFKTFEKIINAKVWLKDFSLIGFELKTDFGRNLKIGYGENGEETSITDLEEENKIVLGMGVDANLFCVNSIYFYYIDKDKYQCFFNTGLFELRSKLKMNEIFRKNIELKKQDMDEVHKLMVDICELPDTSFFPIISYLYDI